jgi:hypothetical protein
MTWAVAFAVAIVASPSGSSVAFEIDIAPHGGLLSLL